MGELDECVWEELEVLRWVFEVEELLVRLARGGAFTIYIKLLTKLINFGVTG